MSITLSLSGPFTAQFTFKQPLFMNGYESARMSTDLERHILSAEKDGLRCISCFGVRHRGFCYNLPGRREDRW